MAKKKEVLPKPEIPPELSELDRLKRDVYRPDMEKFYLFTKMLRENAILKKAIVRHKPEISN